MKAKVIITIPIYKKELSYDEKISLRQVKRILGRYPIVFFCPVNLKFNYGTEYASFGVERFPDEFFRGRHSYSRLMMSKEFYERFSRFEYILVYQLDAFVFRDELEEFCSLGYDYIGAPMPRTMPDWGKLGARIGNGGFSLRKASKALEMIDKKRQIIDGHPMAEEIEQNEDMFWGLCGIRPELGFHVPDVKTGLRFAVEQDIRRCYRNLSSHVPFGCHAWGKFNYSLWKPIIEGYGYELDDGLNKINAGWERRWRVHRYLWERALQPKHRERIAPLLGDLLDLSKFYALWGAGIDGALCVRIMFAAQAKVTRVYDRRKFSGRDLCGVPVCVPSKNILQSRNETVIISTLRYEAEIASELEDWGLTEGRDFLRFSQLEKAIWKQVRCRLGFQERS